MKTLLILLSLVLFTSCLSLKNYVDKKYNEVCIKCLKEFVSKMDTSKDSIIIDTTKYLEELSVESVDQYKQYLKDLILRCDSNNQVILVRTDQLSKNYLKYKGKYENNLFILTIYQDSVEYYKKEIQIEKTKVKTKIITIKGPSIIEKKVPLWTWITMGILCLAFIILGIAIIKIYKK
jgi:hypothetical protein